MKPTGKSVFIFVMAVFFISLFACAAKDAYRAGIYSATAEGNNGPITVDVRVSSSKIEDITVSDSSESDFTDDAVDSIIKKVIASNGTGDIDSISGATYTSKGLIAAIDAAIAQAATGAAVTAGGESAKKAEDISCDIVIVGAGGAGLCASVQAASQGAKVIVLEKMAIVGGNTNYATGGLNASQTAVQEKLGIRDSNDIFFADTMKGGKNVNNPALVHTLVDRSAETVDWLIGLGANLSDVGKMGGSTNKRTHRPQGGGAVGGHLVKVLAQAAKNAGVDIRLETRAVEILNQEGKAAGVKVSSPAGSYMIHAKAVIIATGGFGANSELVVSYKSNLDGFGTTNHPGAKGDAISLVKPFDAAFVDMEQIQTHPTVVPVKNTMITEAVRGNGAIVVNRSGKRFESELVTRDIMSAAILKQTGKTAFIVFDQGVRDSLSAIETYAKKGLLVQAETVEKLGIALGIDPDALAETLARYNTWVDEGKDSDFGRKDLSRKLAASPFYAVEVGPAVHHTMGGVKINTQAQVLNRSGNAIPGLFAAGEVTGGVHGANRLGGNAVADITVFGRIAGNSAVAYIQNHLE